MSSKRTALSADIESIPTPSKKSQVSIDDDAVNNKRKVDTSELSNQIEVKPPKSPKKGIMNKSFESHKISIENVDIAEVPRNASTSSSTSIASSINTGESIAIASPKRTITAVAEG